MVVGKRTVIIASATAATLLLGAFLWRSHHGRVAWWRQTSTQSNPQAQQNGDILDAPAVRWSEFAYTQYVTNLDYLCNSVMLFQILHRLESKAERLLMYPDTFHIGDGQPSKEVELLLKAQTDYDVKLKPVSVISMPGHDRTWAESFTKLLAFNQTEYKRVLNLDSDSTVLQQMDELFLIPSAPVAMPRAYWNPGREKQLSSQLMLVEPSSEEFSRVHEATLHASGDTYDMEIMNDLYYESCIVLPHRKYDLLTGEFRREDGNHTLYLGNDYEKWDPRSILDEAKFLHFSDWPVPKPWKPSRESHMQEEEPSCFPQYDGDRSSDCSDKDLWLGFYEDFRRRRKDVCGMDIGMRGA